MLTDDEIMELAEEKALAHYDIYFAVPPSRSTVIDFARTLLGMVDAEPEDPTSQNAIQG